MSRFKGSTSIHIFLEFLYLDTSEHPLVLKPLTPSCFSFQHFLHCLPNPQFLSQTSFYNKLPKECAIIPANVTKSVLPAQTSLLRSRITYSKANWASPPERLRDHSNLLSKLTSSSSSPQIYSSIFFCWGHPSHSRYSTGNMDIIPFLVLPPHKQS